MKAIVVTQSGGPEVLALQDVEEPVPGPGEVLIQVKSAGVNYADIKARTSGLYQGQRPPFIAGLDVAGTIVGTGSAVKHLEEGQRVIAFPRTGSYTEMTVADGRLTFPIPDSLDFDTAAAFPVVGGTAYGTIAATARLQPGESILIHAAAGGVGTTAIQISKLLGAALIIAATRSPWKKEQVLALGADKIIDNSVDSYPDQINYLTAGAGVDVIINPVGGKSIENDLQCLAPFGRLVLFGNMGGGTCDLDAVGMYKNNRSLLGFSFGHRRKQRPETVGEIIQAVMQMVVDNKIQILIDKHLPLAQAAEAHRRIEERQNIGKILLDIGTN